MTPPAVGLFGGTFDPVHNAHLRMARAFIAEAGLDALHLVPAGEPYHRPQDTGADAAQRLEMVRMAVTGEPAMEADDREIRRGGHSYTVETLEEMRAEIGPDAALWFLIGSDSLLQLDHWKRWHDLFALAHLAVAVRPGFDERQLPQAVHEQWLLRRTHRVPIGTASGKILRLALTPLDLSASAIRTALAAGQDISSLVPPEIAAYIARHGLYR